MIWGSRAGGERRGELAVPAPAAARWERRWLSLRGAAPRPEPNPSDLIPGLRFLQLRPLVVEMLNEAPARGGEGVFAGDRIRVAASDPPPVHAKGGIWGCETMA